MILLELCAVIGAVALVAGLAARLYRWHAIRQAERRTETWARLHPVAKRSARGPAPTMPPPKPERP